MMQPMLNEIKRFNLLLSEINAAYHEAALRLGLTDSAMLVLYTICTIGNGCPLAEIVRCSGASKQTVNSAIRRLEQDGMLYLAPDGSKKKTVYLTADGRELTKQTVARVIEVENTIFSAWPREDIEKIIALSQTYLTAFRQHLTTL